MRDIKFRGWNRKEKEMQFDTNHYSLDHDIMQYTGLKDRNGVEIYEGDIVENVGPHSATVQRYGFEPFSSHRKKFVVTKELVGFTLRHVVDYATQLKSPKGIDGLSPNGFYSGNGSMPPIDNYQFWNYQSSFEVIGNIHEHPHLLEEERT